MDTKDAVSDATTAAPVPQQPPTNISDSTRGSFPFLVHSQVTLTNNLPPNVDNQPLIRQKRRRTRYVFAFNVQKTWTRPQVFLDGKGLCVQPYLQS